MTNNEAIGILAIVVETAKGRCFVTDEAISDAYAMAISALQEQEELYVYSQCKTCRYYHDDDDVRCMICDDENDMYEGQEAKTQLSREDTTLWVQKTCVTCKHYPESKWPCIDCDMRNPADRWEPQELSKNSTELDKENGELHPTCTGSEELKQEAKHSNESSLTQKALDTISRQAVRYKLTALVNEFEEILSHIREREVDDSVCGLCEYDGAYIGQSGDWCNECPGFEKDDCFKLKEKYRKEWTDINE